MSNREEPSNPQALSPMPNTIARAIKWPVDKLVTSALAKINSAEKDLAENPCFKTKTLRARTRFQSK